MKNVIVVKIIEYEKSNKQHWYTEFLTEFNNDYNNFSKALIMLRDTELECITDSILNEKICSCSNFFSGIETILFDIVSLMLFYEIDSENTIKFIINRRNELYNERKPGTLPFDLFYDSLLTGVFLKTFEIHNGKTASYRIEDFIKTTDIKDASMANMYFSIIKKTNRELFKNLPKKLVEIGFLTEAINIIDDKGLIVFLKRYKKAQINSIVEILNLVGANQIGKIISYCSGYTDNNNKLKNFENKIYSLEQSLNLNLLIDNYLKN